MSNVSFSLSKALLNSKRLNWLYKDNIHYSCIPIPHHLIMCKKIIIVHYVKLEFVFFCLQGFFLTPSSEPSVGFFGLVAAPQLWMN